MAIKLGDSRKAKESGEKLIRIIPENVPIAKSLNNMGNLTPEQFKSMEKLFHVSYLIGIKGRPYSDFTDLLELEKLHDVKFMPSGKYENESACRTFLRHCSQAIFDKDVKSKLSRANFISVLCDGSTDISVIEK